MAAKRLPRLNGFWLLSVLIGVLLLVSISFYSANTDIATAEDALSTRVDYIKEQCADYSSLNLASEAKSLLRVGAQVENLHDALQVVAKQAAQWRMFVPHGGWPVLPNKLDDIIATQEELARDLTALDAVLSTTVQGGDLE